jgi:poly(3-hydroxybutyrate) depolymerase
MTPVQLHAKIEQNIRDFSPLAEKEGFTIEYHLKNSGYGQDWHAWQEWSVWEKRRIHRSGHLFLHPTLEKLRSRL